MAKFRLSPYYLHVRKKYQETNLYLNNFKLNSIFKNFDEIIHDFCMGYINDVEDFGDTKRTFSIENLTWNKKNRLVYGTIKSGEYGLECDFFDTSARTRSQGARKETDSEEHPFFFIFHCPAGGICNRGILIFSKFRAEGAKTLFYDALKKYLNRFIEDYTLVIKSIISENIIQELESAERIVEIHLIGTAIPADDADKIQAENYEDITRKMIYSVKPGKNIQMVLDGLAEKLRDRSTPYFMIENERAEQVTAIVENSGAQRTVYLQHDPRIREVKPLDENQLGLSGGFPTQESLLVESIEYLNSILEQLGEEIIDLTEEDD